MKYGNWTLGQTEALLNILGGEEKAMAILSRTVEVVVKVVSYITATWRFATDWSRSIVDLVKAGKYDWVNGAITDANFPITEHDKVTSEKEMALFGFGKTVSSEEAIMLMLAEGYRPATMREMLAFGEKNPKAQLENPIVALGQFAELDGDRHVGSLFRLGSERDAYLDFFDSDWSDDYRFLAVRN